jgi:hypothetical protein
LKRLSTAVLCAALLVSVLVRANPAAAISSGGLTSASKPDASSVASAHHAKDATLRVVVGALPRSLPARIVLAGPHRLRKRVTRSISLRLPAGGYTLSAGPVRVLAGAYYATVPRLRERLRAGRVTTVTVHYATMVPKTTSIVPASGTASLAGQPSGPRMLTLTGSAAHGARAGEILVSGSTAAAPNGYLVKVTKVARRSDGAAVLDVENTTLLRALPSGEIDTEQTLEAPADAASLRDAGAVDLRLGRAQVGSRLARAAGFSLHPTDLTCATSAGVHLTPMVSFAPSIALHAKWGFFKLDSASFTATVTARLSLDASAEAGAHCETSSPGIGLLPHPISLPDIDIQVGPLPVVITPKLQLYLTGSASVSATVSASVEQSASATVGASYNGSDGRITPISSFSQHFTPSFTAEGDASAELALSPTVDTLIYGVAGPSFDVGVGVKFDADTAKTPWWMLQGCLQGGVGFVFELLDINWSEPHLISVCKTLLSATSGPPATHAPPSSPAPPVTVTPTPTTPGSTVPATGPTLVYEGNTEGSETDGDTSFTDWAAATGQPAEVQATLPSELTHYRCVVLLLNQSFEQAQSEALASYLRAGGTILALGEHYGFNGADEGLNGFASFLGVGLALNINEYNESQVTSYIDPSVLAKGVTELGYSDVSTLTVSGGGRPLVEIETPEGRAPLVAEEGVGAGTFVLSGDSNMFSDNNAYGPEGEGFYETYNNGRFVQNLCP